MGTKESQLNRLCAKVHRNKQMSSDCVCISKQSNCYDSSMHDCTQPSMNESQTLETAASFTKARCREVHHFNIKHTQCTVGKNLFVFIEFYK